MIRYRPLLPVLLFLLIGAALLLSCGGGNGLPLSSQVVISIAPQQASVAAGGTVKLVGSATGFTQAPIVQWWIQEAKDSGAGDDCGYLTLPPMSSCLSGYVVFGSVTQFPSPATYYAPLSPGTYHVTFEANQFVEFGNLTKRSTATITVTQ